MKSWARPSACSPTGQPQERSVAAATLLKAGCFPLSCSELLWSCQHRITWHEANSAAQHELDKDLKGGADKLGNVLPLHMDA